MGVARDLRFSSSYKLSDGRLLVESEYFLKNGIRFLLPKEIKVVSSWAIGLFGKNYKNN